ncbi:uncharacterized protein CLUP02_11326 [Colletotrichum lupini]|uniref:Uncharacterized protein n=1 Tax=Colletotrichum lupini TaxID=145971 RepID=A0A9Q8SYF4_9PEZI|nr:uncharacterized protein CLUP02_11326 [Colletotrichum lupini]UQC85827.1 hypothetical protein CLUP02_11326 [Colletotrichum lupini]
MSSHFFAMLRLGPKRPRIHECFFSPTDPKSIRRELISVKLFIIFMPSNLYRFNIDLHYGYYVTCQFPCQPLNQSRFKISQTQPGPQYTQASKTSDSSCLQNTVLSNLAFVNMWLVKAEKEYNTLLNLLSMVMPTSAPIIDYGNRFPRAAESARRAEPASKLPEPCYVSRQALDISFSEVKYSLPPDSGEIDPTLGMLPGGVDRKHHVVIASPYKLPRGSKMCPLLLVDEPPTSIGRLIWFGQAISFTNSSCQSTIKDVEKATSILREPAGLINNEPPSAEVTSAAAIVASVNQIRYHMIPRLKAKRPTVAPTPRGRGYLLASGQTQPKTAAGSAPSTSLPLFYPRRHRTKDVPPHPQDVHVPDLEAHSCLLYRKRAIRDSKHANDSQNSTCHSSILTVLDSHPHTFFSLPFAPDSSFARRCLLSAQKPPKKRHGCQPGEPFDHPKKKIRQKVPDMSDPLSVKPRHANVPGRGATEFITERRIGDMYPRSRRKKRQGGEISFLPAMTAVRRGVPCSLGGTAAVTRRHVEQDKTNGEAEHSTWMTPRYVSCDLDQDISI